VEGTEARLTPPIVPIPVAIYFTSMRNSQKLLLIPIIALSLAPAVSAQNRADYFLIIDPSHYSISNEYQQPLSADEQRRYLPCSPLRIIEKEVIMGDQISRALKFSYLFETGYLLMDEKGGFTGEKTRSNRQILNGC
jgi:hypothetical protein